MCWLKRDIWKAGIALAGMLLLLVLMVWVPVSAAGAYDRASGLATPVTGTVQATPTEDATVTALNKEKLAQEVQQLKNQNEPDLFGWLRTNAAILLSTLVIVIGGLIGLFRWFGDRRSEREKQAEVRFQAAVTGLGDEQEGAKIGAAILLRTFLRPGYEQFYTQTFDLAVANLRPTRTSPQSEDPDGIPHSPENPDTPLPLTTLRQALIVVFKEAFPLARERVKTRRTLESSFLHRIIAFRQLKRIEEQFGHQSLDATYIQLDKAYLAPADLRSAWMPQSSLREANLTGARLATANLRGAYLARANLRGAILYSANLSGANLSGADLSNVHLSGANLTGAILYSANLSGAHLVRANLRGAYLSEVHNLEDALSLEDTNLRRVTGLTKKQKDACKAKGAIIDEDTTTSPPQSPVSPPMPEPRADVQAPSAPSAQVNTPPPDTDGSSAPSSKSDPDS